MTLLITPKEHITYLRDCVNRTPKHTIFASFGLYAGIDMYGRDIHSWGGEYTNATRELLESMRPLKDVKIIIGVTDYSSCKDNKYCKDCEVKYAKNLIRLLNHVEIFPEFKWKFSTSLHLKAYLFVYDKSVSGVAGGRNLTNSSWEDVSFTLSVEQFKVLYDRTIKVWGEARDLTSDSLGLHFKSQNISERSLEALGDMV